MNINTLAAVITATLMVVGCAKQDDKLTKTTGEPSPLGIRLEVAAQSRSVVTGTALSHGNQIGVILHDAGATTVYNGAMMAYELKKPTAAAGVWIATETQGLMVSEPAKVLAYFPASLPADQATLATDKKSIAIALPSTLDLGAMGSSSAFESFWMTLKTGESPSEIFVCKKDVDYMIGQGTDVSTAIAGTKETLISMKHALAMVVVYVKRSANVTDPVDVRAITIRNATGETAMVQGSFDLTNNAFTPNTTVANYERTMSGFPIDASRYAMLVYPASMSEGVTEMVLKTDNTEYKMLMPAKDWVSGKVYVYNVEISTNKAQIGMVTLADWPAWTNKPFELD